MSELLARLLTTDPERRPSAKEILEILTVQEQPVSVTMTSLGLWDDPLGFQRDQLSKSEAMPTHYPAYPGYEAAPPNPFLIKGGQCEAGGGHGVTVTTVPGDVQQPSAASSRGLHTAHRELNPAHPVFLRGL